MVDGFKDSTRTHYSKGGTRGGPKGAAKVSTVMGAFKSGRNPPPAGKPGRPAGKC